MGVRLLGVVVTLLIASIAWFGVADVASGGSLVAAPWWGEGLRSGEGVIYLQSQHGAPDSDHPIAFGSHGVRVVVKEIRSRTLYSLLHSVMSESGSAAAFWKLPAGNYRLIRIYSEDHENDVPPRRLNFADDANFVVKARGISNLGRFAITNDERSRLSVTVEAEPIEISTKDLAVGGAWAVIDPYDATTERDLPASRQIASRKRPGKPPRRAVRASKVTRRAAPPAPGKPGKPGKPRGKSKAKSKAATNSPARKTVRFDVPQRERSPVRIHGVGNDQAHSPKEMQYRYTAVRYINMTYRVDLGPYNYHAQSVSQLLEENDRILRGCYEDLLDRSDRKSGSLTYRVHLVRGSGEPARVRLLRNRMKDRVFAQCFTDTLRSIIFEAPERMNGEIVFWFDTH